MSREELDSALEPVLQLLSTLDPAKPEQAIETLREKFPVSGNEMRELASLFANGVEEGWLCDRKGSDSVSYSRVLKAQEGELSIDAVRMTGPGPGHTHPNGEFDLCFASEGDPAFDGNPPGWVVYPPNSWHVPTVEGGTMNIFYFLPDGAINFGPRPS